MAAGCCGLTQHWTDYRNCPFMSFRPRNWVSGIQVEEATLSDEVSKNTFLLQSLVRRKKNILCGLFIHILSQENDFKQCTVLWRVTVYFKAHNIDTGECKTILAVKCIGLFTLIIFHRVIFRGYGPFLMEKTETRW